MLRHVSALCFLLLVAWLIPAPPALAQGIDDGSLYSRFGLGQLHSFASSQIQAMGGGATALWTPCNTFVTCAYVNFSNPAAWADQVLVRASLSARIDGLRVTDAANNTKRLTSGSLGALQFGLPLKTRRLGLAFAFEPYSRVNYRVQTTGQLVRDPVIQDTVFYQINHEGSGGLYEIRGGGGYRLNDHLSLGASAHLIFGIIEEGRRNTFENAALAETRVATSTRLVGFTGTLGALFNVDNALSDNDHFSAAASFTLPASLEATRARTLGESLDRDTLGTLTEGSVDLPWGVRGGLAYQFDDRWTLVADARYEPWTQFASDLSFPGYTPRNTGQLQDRLRVSGGMEVLPAGTDLLEPYLARIAYRIGAYYDQWYITPVAGTPINAMAVTGGLSLPSVFPGTRLDVNVEVGTRGTTDENLVRDSFIGVSATLNVGERWFVKRKLQ